MSLMYIVSSTFTICHRTLSNIVFIKGNSLIYGIHTIISVIHSMVGWCKYFSGLRISMNQVINISLIHIFSIDHDVLGRDRILKVLFSFVFEPALDRIQKDRTNFDIRGYFENVLKTIIDLSNILKKPTELHRK